MADKSSDHPYDQSARPEAVHKVLDAVAAS
eukprot:SAG31_NODE_8700_length_1403_cov_1.648773_3_plen_29_part_01